MTKGNRETGRDLLISGLQTIQCARSSFLIQGSLILMPAAILGSFYSDSLLIAFVPVYDKMLNNLLAWVS